MRRTDMKSTAIKAVSLALSLLMLIPAAVSCAGNDSKTPENSENVTTDQTTTETPEEDPVMDNYTLEGKTFIFLGSSVTYGSANGGVSFCEYIAERNDCTCKKYAISGTTLVDNGSNSYVQRMNTIVKKGGKKCDHFICQLSTNDASQNKPLGNVSESFEKGDFDTSTITGAMEYIIASAKDTWKCPVSFYINPKYDSAAYQKMVDRLYELKEKWGIGVLDFWNDEEANSLNKAQYAKYMSDSIHPTGAGYLEWWTPKFEEFLLANHK